MAQTHHRKSSQDATSPRQGSTHSSSSHSHRRRHHRKPTEPLEEIRMLLEQSIIGRLGDEIVASTAKNLYICSIGLRVGHWIAETRWTRDEVEELATLLAHSSLMHNLALLYDQALGRCIAIFIPSQLERLQAETDPEGQHLLPSSKLADTSSAPIHRWFCLWSADQRPRLIDKSEIPWLDQELLPLLQTLKQYMQNPSVDKLLVATLGTLVNPDASSPNEVALAIRRKRSSSVIMHVLSMPVVYCYNELDDPAAIIANVLQSECYMVNIDFEGTAPEDDHTIHRATFPAAIFAGNADIDDVIEVNENLPTIDLICGYMENWLHSTMDRVDQNIFRDATCQVTGPMSHRKSWLSAFGRGRIFVETLCQEFGYDISQI